MKYRAWISLVLTLSALSVATARGEQVSGRVRVTGRADRAPTPTMVYAESLEGATPTRPGRFKLEQRRKAFSPRMLAIPAGSTVDFPNQDPIFHNVFSISRPGPFDLGLYRAGASKERVFKEPANYRVFCNIHPQMTAVILVLGTSYVTQADGEGAYRLDLPPGRYRITAWSERSQPATSEIAVSGSALSAPELSLDESKFVEAPHKNKFGQDYPASAYDPLKDSKAR